MHLWPEMKGVDGSTFFSLKICLPVEEIECAIICNCNLCYFVGTLFSHSVTCCIVGSCSNVCYLGYLNFKRTLFTNNGNKKSAAIKFTETD